jgi:hypothetical protein
MHEAFNSAEWNLVLGSCSLLAQREGETTVVTNPPDSLDESILRRIVERHRIAPLVYMGIKDLPLVSEEFKASLRSRVLANQVEVLAVKQFMIGFHDFIAPLGYDHLFLKGLVVAEQYYDDPGLRSAVDVDLWVEPAGIDAVSQWLIAMGYRADWGLQGFNHKQIKHLKRVGHEICFTATKPNLPKLIELHTRIDSPYSKFVYHPTQEKKTFSNLNIGGMNFSVMNHEDQFLYLCVHGTAHAWFRLKWLCDLTQLMHRLTLDWERVRGRSILL